MRVLIVDDEQLIHDVVGTILDLEEFDVDAALSVAEAWVQIEAVRPDIIVSDVMMPGDDGLKFCRDLRADDRCATLPVVLLTAIDDSEHRQAALDAGADAYMTKPFSPLALIETIQRLLEQR